MKKIILLLSCLLLAGQLTNANNTEYQHQKDSLMRVISTTEGEEHLTAYKNYIDLISYYESEIDTLIHHYGIIIRMLDDVNDTERGLAMRTSLISMCKNHNAHQKVIELVPGYMELMAAHENWSLYLQLYDSYAMAYLYIGQKEKAIEETQLFYQKVKDLNHPESAYPLYTLAKIYEHSGRLDEALTCLKQAMEQTNRYKEITDLKICMYYDIVQTLFQRINSNIAPHELSEITEYMDQWQADVEAYEVENGEEPVYRVNLYIQRHKLELLRQNIDKAEHYINLMEELGIQGANVTHIIYSARRDIAMKRKDWKEALRYNELLYEIFKENKNLHNLWATTEMKAVSLFHLHETSKGMQALFESTALRDSMNRKEIHAQLDELRTRYEVDRHILEKENQRTYTLAAIGGCLLLLAILTIYIIYSRKLKAKNRRLYQQIQDSLRRDRQAEQALATAPAETLTRETDLYRRLNELMQAEHLFTRPDIERRALADRLGTNERYLSDAIHQEAGETVSAYIARLRLQYALELLETHPELTLEAVATESGHASYSPFYRAFGKMYGMSPSEYRRLSAKKEI